MLSIIFKIFQWICYGTLIAVCLGYLLPTIFDALDLCGTASRNWTPRCEPRFIEEIVWWCYLIIITSLTTLVPFILSGLGLVFFGIRLFAK